MSSLADRRVVVTRAAEQAGDLVTLIESCGGRAVVVPLVEIVDEPAAMALLATLEPTTFDWLVFTSANGAQRGEQAGITAATVPGPRIAAVGSATARVLGRVDLVAERQSAAGLLEAFPPGPGRVLVVQAVDATPTLVDGLAEKGYLPTVIAPYRTVTVVPKAATQLAALAADAVLFASGSAARAWVEVFGTSTPPIVVAIGPQTAAGCTRAGLKVTVIAADHSLTGMVAALETWLQPE